MKQVSELRKSALNIHFELLEMLAIGLASIPLLSVWLLSIDFMEVDGAGPETVPVPRRLMGREVNHLVYGATALAAAAALGFLAWRGSLRSAIVSPFSRLKLPFGLGLGAGACLVGAVIVAVSVATIHAPLWVAHVLGPFGLLCLFFGVLTIASSMMTAVYDRHGWPILSGLALAALLFGYMGWSNNHEVQSLPEQAKTEAKPGEPTNGSERAAQPSAEKSLKPGEAFAHWLKARPDRPHYVGRPYPVYIVAAEGGGLYAAAHAASVLARLQDECPGFARHVFAISGVSGGSLGAAVFTSLIDALPPAADSKGCERIAGKEKPLLPLVERYFQNDFLSPLLAYGLFPDFLQRFLPLGIPQFDRARGLEAAFEAAWKDTLAQVVGRVPETTAFGSSFRDLWSADASKPALLLNATSVHYGNRVVIAPFLLRDRTGFIDQRIDLLNQGKAIALSTAVGVSARYPIITPAGWAKSERSSARLQLVDGGFYENSGIATSVHLIDAIIRGAGKPSAPQDGSAGPKDAVKDGACAPNNTAAIDVGEAGRVAVCFRLIVIRELPKQPSFVAQSELTAPLVAAYNLRYGHSSGSTARAMNAYCGGANCGVGALAGSPHVYFRYLTARELPLGWYVSKHTLARVVQAAPPEAECLPQPKLHELDVENACLVRRLREDLK
jgi:hypothetical protein